MPSQQSRCASGPLRGKIGRGGRIPSRSPKILPTSGPEPQEIVVAKRPVGLVDKRRRQAHE